MFFAFPSRTPSIMEFFKSKLSDFVFLLLIIFNLCSKSSYLNIKTIFCSNLCKKNMSSNLIGNNIVRLNSVDSTNNYAAKMINQTNIPFGTVIMSHFQTSGKGQRASNWISPKATNLLFSVILDTSFMNPLDVFQLSKAISLSLKMAVSELVSKKVSIKWPNDILVDGCKIAGILIENQWAYNKLKSSIVGVGLNVNQTDFNGSFSATSLKMLSNKNYLLDDVLNLIIKYLNIYFEYLRNCDNKIINEEYFKYLFRYNEWSNYKSIGSLPFLGRITSVSREGLIEIQKKDGSLTSYDLKEISYVL